MSLQLTNQHIISLEVENFKRIKALRVEPDGKSMTITGDNSTGKTSFIDALFALLAGKKGTPDDPIHHGATKAVIKAETELLMLRKVITGKTTQIKVTAKDGSKLPGTTQAVLDTLYDTLTFDCERFANMKAPEQASVLMKLAGLDFAAADAERAEKFTKRTDLSRDLRAAQALLDAATYHRDAPVEEVSIVQLVAERDRRKAVNDANDIERNAIGSMLSAAGDKKADIVEAEEALLKATKALDDMRVEMVKMVAAGKAKRIEVDALVDEEVSEISGKIDSAETDNSRVRDNGLYIEKKESLEKLERGVESLTEWLEGADEAKADKIKAAKYPVEGLEVTEMGVTLNGVPFDQGGEAERIRASALIGMELSGGLRLMVIRRGSLFSPAKRTALLKLAAERDIQLLTEVVTEGEEVGIIIESGES